MGSTYGGGTLPPAPPYIARTNSKITPYGGGSLGPPDPPPHDPSLQAHTGMAHAMSPQQVRSMQQFLINHGFSLSADGIMGPMTKSAAQSFRSSHLSGPSWNAQHGIGVHPGALSPEAQAAQTAADHPTTPTGHTGHTAAQNQSAGGQDPFGALLASLLGQGGNVGHMLDPNTYATAAAAPDQAQIQTLLQEIGMAPKQEAQNQQDISSWYGLNPKDPNYNISVLGRLGQAKAGDAAMSSAAAANDPQLAAALAASIGGSANGGSGSLAAAGANDAKYASDIGAANTNYESAMNPLLAAEAVGSMAKEKAAGSQATLALQQALAQARGQATADAAGGRATAIDKNNALAQQQFANKGNLLGIESQMASSGLKTEYTQAQIAHLLAEANKANSYAPRGATPPKFDPTAALNRVGTMMNLPSGTNKIPLGGEQKLATTIGNVLRGMGLHPGDGMFKRMGDQLLSQFVDQNGKPIAAGPGWLV